MQGTAYCAVPRLYRQERLQKYEPGANKCQRNATQGVPYGVYTLKQRKAHPTQSRAGCASCILCGRDDVGIVHYIVLGEETLTSSALPQQPQPRKRQRRPWGCCPCPGSPSFPHQIRLSAALCLRRKAFSCSKLNFSQIRKHVSHSNRMCFLNWLHLIISPVHETSPFDFIEHPSSSFCISSHLPSRSKSQKFSFLFLNLAYYIGQVLLYNRGAKIERGKHLSKRNKGCDLPQRPKARKDTL